MKVKYKEKLTNPLKGWRIPSAISSMVFHTVQCGMKADASSYLVCLTQTKARSHLQGEIPDYKNITTNPAFGRHWISQLMRIVAPIPKRTEKDKMGDLYIYKCILYIYTVHTYIYVTDQLQKPVVYGQFYKCLFYQVWREL